MSINSFVDRCRENLSCKQIVLNAVGGCIAGRFFGISPSRGAVCAVAKYTVFHVASAVNSLAFSKIYNQIPFLAKGEEINKRVISLATLTSSCLACMAVISLLGKQVLASTMLGFGCTSYGIALIGDWILTDLMA